MAEAKQQLVAAGNDDAVSETQAIIQVIERAAANPNIDVDKMERLLQMQERILARNAETAFGQAMADAQSEIRQIAADASNPQTKSKYASYAAIDKELRPIYTRNGFALSFDTSPEAAPETVRVLCYVSHRHGHTRTYSVDMPADGKGARGGDVMTKTHAAGAAMQYGMRYLIKLIFNVAVAEDDDGNGAGRRKQEPPKRPEPPVHQMPEQQKADFTLAIEACVDRQAVDNLWATIAETCKKLNNKYLHAHFKELVRAKIKSLQGAK